MKGTKCHIVGVITLLFLMSCSAVSLKTPVNHVVLDQDSNVTINGSKQPNKKGDVLVLKDEPMLVEAPGHLSVLVMPVLINKAPKKVTVKLPKLSHKTVTTKLAKRYNDDLDKILTEVYEIQILISGRKVKSALARLQELKREYENVAYLKFMEASCHYLLGNKTVTRKLLESALTQYPNHELGLNLYNTLLRPGEFNRFNKKRKQ